MGSNENLKLLLVDGNNMSHRVFWTHKNLQYRGTHTGLLFGFLKQLIYLRKKFPGYYFVIAWDRGYNRRRAESNKAVEMGIIPSGYKAQREEARAEADSDKLDELESLNTQMEQLQDVILPLVRCSQIYRSGVEADDLIYSYCKYVNKYNGSAVVVSSDKDFLQVLGLGQGMSVYDAMKSETWTIERFEAEFGFSPELWVDAGALMGDKSDNIFGVDGWGPKTSCDYVRRFGSVENVIKEVEKKKKKLKRDMNLLNSIDRLNLAMSLKKMDDIPDLPRPKCDPKDSEVLKQKFIDFGFASLIKEARILT